MAKSRRGRDASPIANRRLPLVNPNLIKPVPAYANLSLQAVQDRRRFTPQPYVARSLSGQQHSLRVQPDVPRRRSRHLFPSPVVAFTTPKKMAICVRRQQRKEVLHAFRKTGKVGQKRPRRNYFSGVAC